ncbi:MAG TPA: hypothetical protein DCR93_11755, partial [Cytophagales bacterium]|nr:hypothetical protein [Cytophagales bacterium]
MDYGGGTQLAQRQWEYIRNPQSVNTLGEEDSTGASFLSASIPEELLFPPLKTATFLSPHGKAVVLPSNARSLTFFFGLSSMTGSYTVTGSLLSFVIDGVEYSHVANGHYVSLQGEEYYYEGVPDSYTSNVLSKVLMVLPYDDGIGFLRMDAS